MSAMTAISLLRSQRRRGILRQLFPGAIGTLYIQFVEEERWRDDRTGQRFNAVVHVGVASRSDDVPAQGSYVQVFEDGAADQLHVAVAGIDPPHQAGSQLRPSGLNVIAVGTPLVFAHLHEFGFELVKAEGIGALEDQVGNERSWPAGH